MKIAMLAAFATCAITAGEPINDVDGWQEAKWGMSQSAITERFNGGVKPDRINPARFLRLVEPVAISGSSFDVVFRFGEVSKALDAVSLFPKSANGDIEVLCSQLQELLVQKYGAPSLNEDTSNKDTIQRKYTWLYPSTILTLDFYNSRRMGSLYSLRLTYQKRDTSKNPL